eukprot:CAMPEP_0204583742 /NCGR_PEP_ID=MMETSP0661-20131031/45949_1 /ASSEMBLY_ACC=CAM_ASM_000606 /TAXON_ID=109239 /ORGANISM="Alexandrium margalefi, Strain AMGDE01CS-322" /LENGTH=196 /DNA_ID=CAMNT_0051593127 /DNA_START=54 /DNA_END=640 /DNA_ORIENTATION=-
MAAALLSAAALAALTLAAASPAGEGAAAAASPGECKPEALANEACELPAGLAGASLLQTSLDLQGVNSPGRGAGGPPDPSPRPGIAAAASAPAPAPAGAALASHQEVLLLPLSPGAGEGALILDLVAQHYGLPTLSTDHNVNMTVWLLLALAVLLVFLLMIRCFCCSHDDGEELKSTRDVPRDTGRAERMLRQEVG